MKSLRPLTCKKILIKRQLRKKNLKNFTYSGEEIFPV